MLYCTVKTLLHVAYYRPHACLLSEHMLLHLVGQKVSISWWVCNSHLLLMRVPAVFPISHLHLQASFMAQCPIPKHSPVIPTKKSNRVSQGSTLQLENWQVPLWAWYCGLSLRWEEVFFRQNQIKKHGLFVLKELSDVQRKQSLQSSRMWYGI